MSRQESNREDLIREAVALPERTELQVPAFHDCVTIGFRVTGAMSVFIGQDPVYQFDADSRLRRAYVATFLYRSQQSTLARLQRSRTTDRTILLRQDLSCDELESFRIQMLEHVSIIADAIRDDTATVVRSIPQSLDMRPRIAIAICAVLTADPWLSHEIRTRR